VWGERGNSNSLGRGRLRLKKRGERNAKTGKVGHEDKKEEKEI